MSKRKMTGYAMRQEINRAKNANRAARTAAQRLIDERPGPQTTGMIVAKLAAALGENLDAIMEIEAIIRETEPEQSK